MSKRTFWVVAYHDLLGIQNALPREGRMPTGRALNHRSSSFLLVYCLASAAFCNSGILFTSDDYPELTSSCSLPVIIPS